MYVLLQRFGGKSAKSVEVSPICGLYAKLLIENQQRLTNRADDRLYYPRLARRLDVGATRRVVCPGCRMKPEVKAHSVRRPLFATCLRATASHCKRAKGFALNRCPTSSRTDDDS